MSEAIEESLLPILLEPALDLLVLRCAKSVI
jgi:hypothetical protein